MTTRDLIEARIDATLHDWTTSHWVRNALVAALSDDGDAAVVQAELLLALLRGRRDAVASGH